MGNKRKFLDKIEQIIEGIKKELKKKTLDIGDGFSGSGIVSRLFKLHARKLYTNDLAGYSKTLNECFLSSPTEKEKELINYYIEEANKFADDAPIEVPCWIRKHWAPRKDEDIKENERVYYTRENACRIDRYRFFIEKMPKKYRPYLLAPLLIECSIHTNTSGHFSAFYKKGKKGHYGGKTNTDIKRITKAIKIVPPVLMKNGTRNFFSQQDTNEWIKTIPDLDLIYIDPPYNKHPYVIYYFMLDIINNWDLGIEIPETLRGQPKNWERSKYNSLKHAKVVFEDLIKNIRAKYILISYNDGGIISLPELEKILKKKGCIEKIPVTHNTYNRLIGISNYKRKKVEQMKPKEFLWLVKTYKINS